MENKLLKFKSKKDLLVVLVYLTFILALIFMWVIPYSTNMSDTYLSKIAGTSFIAIILGLFTWSVCSTYYIFDDKFLVCVSGPFRSRVFYSEVTYVKSSYSAWSSLALAFDRVVIVCGKNVLKRTYVSPKNKKLFIEEMRKRINK